MKLKPLFAVVGVFAGCADHPYDPDAPAFDRNAPRVHIVSPARGTIAGDVTHVLVGGTASDDLGIKAVSVNGAQAAVADDGTWVVDVGVAPGTTLLHAVAVDEQGNQGEETRAVVAGPMLSVARHIDSGIRAAVSAPALNALGRGTATFIENGGLMTAVLGMNPVVDVGGGPDCLYAQASITALTMHDADVLMGPTNGAVLVSAVLNDVRVGVHLQWAVSCVDGARDVMLTADRVTVNGRLAVGVINHSLDVQFPNPQVQVTGFNLVSEDVPDGIVQMLGLDAAIGPILGSMTGRLVTPMVERSLSALDDAKTLDVAGTKIDVDVQPTQVNFTDLGGTIILDSSFRAQGDSGGFVLVPNNPPALGMTHGFEIAVADDAANQLLTSMWSAKAFDGTLDLATSPYEDISKLYDIVQLQMKLPPYVDASHRPLELTIGDWIATFSGDGVVPTTVAIHAKSALYVVEGDDGKLRIDLSTPLVTIDVEGDGQFITKGQYDAIKSFAVEHIKTIGSAAVATIPLPVIGDVTPTNLWVDPESDYLLIVGEIQ
ncbi:MAG TPA: hypothetical protein VFV99_16760 [Kofleriaceae bacterium]|nr:hypothetical protein [Kofleriaceae bacterium]